MDKISREEKKEQARLLAERERDRADRKFMKKALKQAEHALALGEVPIGCVIVCDGRVVGRGYNRRNTRKTTLAHAEITAIDQASRKLGDWRLEGCTLYVTLEPCQMCSGAIVQSRIDRVVMGAMNPKAGCSGSILNILDMKEFNHQVEATRGVLAKECTEMLQRFFSELRVRNREEKQSKKRRINMERAVNFLKNAQTYYLATVEGDQPRVRPFGTAHIFEGRLYIQSGKIKPVAQQIAANPKVEICAFKDGEWIRIAGELVEDDRLEARQSMLDAYPGLQGMYKADDGNCVVYYLQNATATISAFSHAPEVFEF